ncbi:MAG TPA: hypothetical protein VFE51_21615 [Verrucomicrobiae bacterium]|nr:hypothetical protein [Verrucomicrobiae bacterium]
MNYVAAGLIAAASLFACGAERLEASEATRGSITHTNWVDRWITNTTEIHLQVNRFVTEYHTNWLTEVRTNYVDLFRTNLVTRMQTNFLVLDAVQTNLVQAYRTNFQTLNLTNWTTVLAFRTNWMTKPITNVVEIDLPRETASPAAVSAASRPALTLEPLTLQATRSARALTNNQVEVQLTVAWRQSASAPVEVQQWRVEREDGSIVCFGQETEFRRALPVGTYKVSVRAQRDSKSPLLAALGTLTVTSREVLLEQKPARSNSSI